MKEIVKFNIKQLGAIKDSSIELAPLMVFSGESGLGKSYVAFLVHYIYLLLTDKDNRLENFFKEQDYNLEDLMKNKQTLRIQTSDLLSWINKDAITYIGYLLGHTNFTGAVEIDIPIKDAYFEITFDEEIAGLDNNEEVFYQIMLKGYKYSTPASNYQFELRPFAQLLKAVLSEVVFGDYLFPKRTFLMPTSRGSLIELNSMPAFSSGMYEEFFNNQIDLYRPLKEPLKDFPNVLQQCLAKINTGDIQRIEGSVIYYTNGIELPITAAASSVKELAPLTLFLKKYSAPGASILFEEPEAHLHPARQIKVADLIGCILQLGSHIQITTHSDYFIRRLNSLIQLYRLREKNPEKYKEISKQRGLKEDCLINPENINTYVLQKNEDGSTRIIKQEIGLEGIPFTSFYDVIEDDITTSQILKKALEEE
ncbi:hypothetical protein FACS189437_04660 [Bacteroidia bacterium]|nr:hypothetical protein FACS189437_04660 [Bacteroidia bacterium]